MSNEYTAPSKPVEWLVTHRDGKEKRVVAQTAFYAAKACGWSMSDCWFEQVDDSKR